MSIDNYDDGDELDDECIVATIDAISGSNFQFTEEFWIKAYLEDYNLQKSHTFHYSGMVY